MKNILLVGFDSAWTAGNSGAITGTVLWEGKYRDLGPPRIVNYAQAESVVLEWQSKFAPERTLILLDQPTIVKNAKGQRPVEHIVSSPVSARRGGMQPANTSRVEMFGSDAPMWPFLTRFGGPADPTLPFESTWVLETYPVLTMIALRWILRDSRTQGRLPKYNPGRRTTFSLEDWRYVCGVVTAALRERELGDTVRWLDQVAAATAPRKSDQDRLDACLCLLVALHIIEGKDCLIAGDQVSGYIVVPHNKELMTELETRCLQTKRLPAEWVRMFHMTDSIAIHCSEVSEMEKSYREMTGAERMASRIAQNREIERNSQARSHWSVSEVAVQLNRRKQRATYGAVAALTGGLARGLMNGRPKEGMYSWIVSAGGPTSGQPTGYTANQIHPDCLTQIRAGDPNVIDNGEELRQWLGRSR